MRVFLALTCAVILLLAVSPCWGAIPHQINYQGMLTDDAGDPLNGSSNLNFKIYGSESGEDSLWWEYHSGVTITDGLFNVILGSTNPLPSSVFGDTLRYLGISVGSDSELSPRIRLTSVGYAYRADWSDTSDYTLKSLMADTANYAFFGPGVTDNDWLFRITDTADTTLTTGGAWGIARYGNTLYGNADSTHVNLGVACTTGRSGQDLPWCTIVGGLKNTASGAAAIVVGGIDNAASEAGAAIVGGANNIASGLAAYLGGGEGNTASGGHATVGGGYQNTASDSLATVGGGSENTADSIAATVAGGMGNSASKVGATVAGGGFNNASGLGASVGGGEANTASGEIAAVAGGSSNTASGRYAAVPGGLLNTASGNYSFAAGRRAKANHQGTFVWADSTDADFASTGDNQFLIRASGGVGIDTTNPAKKLHIGGGGQSPFQTAEGIYVNPNTASVAISAEDNTGVEGGIMAHNNGNVYIGAWSNDTLTFRTNNLDQGIIDTLGNFGIGTRSPSAKLDVNSSTGYNQLRMRTSYTPTGTSDTNGNVGDIAWDDTCIYIKTSAGWKRTKLETF